MTSPKVATCLWYDSQGHDAAKFYVSLIPGSEILMNTPAGPGQAPFMTIFTLAGAPYQAMNGGPRYKLNEAASISVVTEDQGETDRLWAALTADGGAESRCGWLVDRFGLSWQIVPRQLPGLIGGADPAGAKRATNAMFEMRKIDIAALQAAYNGGEG